MSSISLHYQISLYLKKHSVKFFFLLVEYNKDLEEWLCSDTSGQFRTLVRSLLSAEREETVEIDFEMAELDAQKLFDVSNDKT